MIFSLILKLKKLLWQITRQHNSSPKMATRRYMKRIGKEKAIQLHERIYSKI